MEHRTAQLWVVQHLVLKNHFPDLIGFRRFVPSYPVLVQFLTHYHITCMDG